MKNKDGEIAPISEFAKSSKTTHFGFNVSVDDQFSFSDERLANEVGDIMYAMEKNTEAYELEKSGYVEDPQNDYGKYATTGPGKYSFDVEDKYKETKKGKISKTEKKYPLK